MLYIQFLNVNDNLIFEPKPIEFQITNEYKIRSKYFITLNDIDHHYKYNYFNPFFKAIIFKDNTPLIFVNSDKIFYYTSPKTKSVVITAVKVDMPRQKIKEISTLPNSHVFNTSTVFYIGVFNDNLELTQQRLPVVFETVPNELQITNQNQLIFKVDVKKSKNIHLDIILFKKNEPLIIVKDAFVRGILRYDNYLFELNPGKLIIDIPYDNFDTWYINQVML